MPTFCTYFDSHYLPRGMALYESLMRHCPDATLWVLCLDSACHERLAERALPSLRLVTLEALEESFPRLLDVKGTRSRIEYYFTCTPLITKYALVNSPGLDMITYLDSDMYFFASPDPIFEELAGKSVGMTEHRYPAEIWPHMAAYGLYNVGWVSFRHDDEGTACLDLWCDDCLDHCTDQVVGDRYADQKYLEKWPTLFGNTHVIQHLGVNAAPWNIMSHRYQLRPDGVYVDDQPLIIFHFHGFKQKTAWLYDTHAARYGAVPSRVMRKAVFEPYIRALTGQRTCGAPISRGIRYQHQHQHQHQHQPQQPALHTISHVRKAYNLVATIVRGQQVIVVNDTVLF